MKSFQSFNAFVVVCALMVVCLIAPHMWAADVGAKLRCTVVDPTKAVVGHAQLSLKGIGNGFSASGMSNDQGEHIFISVPPGVYQITVEKDGFSTGKLENVTLDLNEVRVLTIPLQISSVSEVVEITGHELSMVPQQTFLRGLADPQRMKELPLNGRNFADLIYTQPGVARDTSGALGTGHAVDGARSSSNNFLINSGDANDPSVPLFGGLSINTSGIPLDALDEFSVITSNATAEYGRSAGGIINIATKSGTEKTHGSLWEFLRNDVLDSRTFFDQPGHKNPFKQNQFGGRLGGEFKNTFYSISYEGFRQRQLVAVNALVPSPGFLAAVPNPAWKALLQGLYPAANLPVAPGSIVGIYASGFNNGRNQDSGFLRLDRSFGRAHQDFVSVAGINGDLRLLGNGIPGTGQQVNGRNWQGVFSDNWMIRPTFYNSFRSSVSRIAEDTTSEAQTSAALQAGAARFSGPFAGQPFSGIDGSPNGVPNVITSTGVFSRAGPNSIFPLTKADNTFHLQDSVAWIKGKHQISAGMEFRRIQANDKVESIIRPTFVVNSSNPLALQSGFVLAQLQNFYTHNNSGIRGYRTSEINLFVQDSFRVHPRLTLDYGLRYELNLPTSEVNGIISNAFVMQNGKPMPCQSLPYGQGMNQVALIVPSQFGISPYCTDKTNFAPRAGFAWDVFGSSKTVVRGGYGVFFDRIYGFTLDQFRANVPFATPTRIGFFPYDGRQASAAVDTTSAFPVSSVDPGLRTPYIQRWHLTISQELTKDMVVNASYVGANGNRLTRNERPNFGDGFADAFRPSNGASPSSIPRNPSDIANNVIKGPFGAVTNLVTNGDSTYHALQLEILKRYSKGLTLQASYTWAHSLDTVSDPFAAGTDSPLPAATLNNLLAPLFAPGSGCPGAFSPAVTAGLLNAVRCATGNNALTADQAAAIFVNQFISKADRRSNYGDSVFDVRHRFTANAIYELPIGRHKQFFSGVTGIADKLISGWQFANIIEAQTGNPLSIFAGTDANFDGDANDRAVATGNLSGLNFAGGGVGIDANGAARQYQCLVGSCPVGQGLGVIDPRLRLGRGAFRAPGLFNMDASISKRIPFGDRYSLQFRSEFFNLLNSVNFAAPVQQINNPSFGTSNGQLLINNTQSRQIQFGLKLDF